MLHGTCSFKHQHRFNVCEKACYFSAWPSSSKSENLAHETIDLWAHHTIMSNCRIKSKPILSVKWSEVKLLSRVRLLVTPWTVACQAPPSMGFSRQEYWSGCSVTENIYYYAATKVSKCYAHFRCIWFVHLGIHFVIYGLPWWLRQ